MPSRWAAARSWQQSDAPTAEAPSGDQAGGATAERPGSRWARLALRTRVTLVAAFVVSLGLAAAAVLLVLSLRSGLVAGLDDTARARAADAAGSLARGDTTTAVSAPGGDSLVQLLSPDGTVLAASPALAGAPPLATLPVEPGAHQQPDGELGGADVRLFTRTTGPGRPVVVVVSPLADVQEAITQLLRRLVVGAPLLLTVICAAVWVLLGYTLRTVDRLRAQVATLSASGLDRRVDVPAARDEVRQLAVTMNDLLDRLQRSALAQRRFVADAAHELRTPLAGLRTRLEVSERAGELSRWQDAAPTLIANTERLGRLVDDLLALARLDESRRLRRVVPVDLDEIVFAEASRWRGTGSVVLDTSRVSAALLDGDPDLLTRVVANLLSNAVRHAATRVRVAVCTSDGQVQLSVTDDGPGVPERERERVFERFHRLDAARARDGGGSGLGLAIVRDAVRAHGGSVVLEDARPGAVVTVRLPQHLPEG